MPLPMQKQDKSKQHSVMQIERAISAGTFRDAEPKYVVLQPLLMIVNW